MTFLNLSEKMVRNYHDNSYGGYHFVEGDDGAENAAILLMINAATYGNARFIRDGEINTGRISCGSKKQAKRIVTAFNSGKGGEVAEEVVGLISEQFSSHLRNQSNYHNSF